METTEIAAAQAETAAETAAYQQPKEAKTFDGLK